MHPIIRSIFDAIAAVEHYTPWAAGILLIVLIALAAKNGIAKKALPAYDSSSKPGKWAWICVAVLWVVVMLNYADRGLLSILNKSITSSIIDPETGQPITNEQFGMISAVFLIVYAALSPVGGYLADRYSRKLIIFASLIVWSVVTWATGMAETYHELLIARTAMGISEAFYIPAALALITDYHRGNTRSMATGLHQSGIYAGQAFAGFGAVVSGEYGWHLTFEMFGFVGVIYGLIVILFLRDPEAAKDGSTAGVADTSKPAAEDSTKFSVGEVLGNLFSTKAMYILLAVWTLTGFANWFIMTWYPRLLQDSFDITEAEAGPMATLPINIVKYVAVLVAAALADAWARSNPNARAIIPGIAFLIAGPCVVLAMLPEFGVPIALSLTLVIVLVSTQGLAQGAMDANLMPILRSQIDERFAATGYGILNLTSVGAGALVSWLGGWLETQGVALGQVLGVAGAVLSVTALLLFSLKIRKA